MQRGDFVQIQPIPLAARLAARRLSLLPDGKLASFFTQAPPELRMSLLRRLRFASRPGICQTDAGRKLSGESCRAQFTFRLRGYRSPRACRANRGDGDH
jgi:hypothetical protein